MKVPYWLRYRFWAILFRWWGAIDNSMHLIGLKPKPEKIGFRKAWQIAQLEID